MVSAEWHCIPRINWNRRPRSIPHPLLLKTSLTSLLTGNLELLWATTSKHHMNAAYISILSQALNHHEQQGLFLKPPLPPLILTPVMTNGGYPTLWVYEELLHLQKDIQPSLLVSHGTCTNLVLPNFGTSFF